MSYTIQPVESIDPVLLRELAGADRFVTHAHNPCLTGILGQTFGWKGGTFIISKDDQPVALFSCMYINGRLVSMPHFSFGGILSCSPDRVTMYSEVLILVYSYFNGSSRRNFLFLIRDSMKISGFAISTKVISWLDISHRKAEEVIVPNQLAKAKRAIKSGLYCVNGGIELLNDFYHVYSRNMLRLGSPVLPKRFFANILKAYTGGDALVFCVYKQKKPVGAGFLLSYAGFYENTWFSTLKSYNSLYPAQLLHTEMIRKAILKGGHTYSFGRSTVASGVHEFKRRWNTQETIIYWNYDQPVKNDLRKAEFLSHLWKCLPLPVANRLGPVVSSRIY